MTEDGGGQHDSVPDFDTIFRQVSGKEPGESAWVRKTDLPALPPEFIRTAPGTPLWIAHPGSIALNRTRPAVHVYELPSGWEFQRDEYDPGENPLGHFFFDARELPITTFLAAVSGFLTYRFFEARELRRNCSIGSVLTP
jgi:hypothetical protein